MWRRVPLDADASVARARCGALPDQAWQDADDAVERSIFPTYSDSGSPLGTHMALTPVVVLLDPFESNTAAAVVVTAKTTESIVHVNVAPKGRMFMRSKKGAPSRHRH